MRPLHIEFGRSQLTENGQVAILVGKDPRPRNLSGWDDPMFAPRESIIQCPSISHSDQGAVQKDSLSSYFNSLQGVILSQQPSK